MRRTLLALTALCLLLAGPGFAASDLDDAIAFLKHYLALNNAYHASVSDLYADEAAIRIVAHMPDESRRRAEMSGTQLKQLAPRAMAMNRQRGERSTLFDIRYTADGARIRITATRHDMRAGYNLPHAIVVARDPAGRFRIVEEEIQMRLEPTDTGGIAAELIASEPASGPAPAAGAPPTQ